MQDAPTIPTVVLKTIRGEESFYMQTHFNFMKSYFFKCTLLPPSPKTM